MKILIAEDQDDLRDLIKLHLELEFNIHCLTARSGNEAIKAVGAHPDLDGIISDYAMPDGSGGDLFRHLLSIGSTIPFVLSSSLTPEQDPVFKSKLFAYLAKPWHLGDLRAAANKLIAASKTRKPPRNQDGFCRINTATLLKFGMLSCDLFIKLGSGRYVKVLKSEDVFDIGDFDRFSMKKVDHLFLKTSDAESFLEIFSRNVLALCQIREVPLEPAFQASAEALAVIAEFNERLGFSKNTQELTRQSVLLTLKSLQENQKLSQLWNLVAADPAQYVCTHSVALAHISCGIASLMGWLSETTFYKLSLAAFVHDLTLRDPELARVQALAELGSEKAELIDAKTAAIVSHPDAAAALLAEMTEVPPDTALIVREHHERPDGMGFPRSLNASEISPLSCVFIVAQDLLEYQLVKKVQLDLVTYLELVSEYYDKGHFKKILKALTENASGW